MSLTELLQNDVKQALKAKNELKKSTLRLLLSSVSYARIEKGDELTDEEVLDVLTREAKRRRESIEAAERGGRSDVADKERAELEIISQYLPKQLGEDEIEIIARQVVDEVGAADMKDKGKVMGPLMQRVRGKADGKLVNLVVEKLLRS